MEGTFRGVPALLARARRRRYVAEQERVEDDSLPLDTDSGRWGQKGSRPATRGARSSVREPRQSRSSDSPTGLPKSAFKPIAFNSLLRGVKRAKVPDNVRPALTEEEMDAILTAYRPGTVEYTVIVLMLGTGLRFNEAREMLVGDVDFANVLLAVRPEISKSKELRTVDVHDAVLKELDRYLRQRDVRKSEQPLSSHRRGQAVQRRRIRQTSFVGSGASRAFHTSTHISLATLGRLASMATSSNSSGKAAGKTGSRSSVIATVSDPRARTWSTRSTSGERSSPQARFGVDRLWSSALQRGRPRFPPSVRANLNDRWAERESNPHSQRRLIYSQRSSPHCSICPRCGGDHTSLRLFAAIR